MRRAALPQLEAHSFGNKPAPEVKERRSALSRCALKKLAVTLKGKVSSQNRDHFLLLWPAFNHIRRGGKPFANHPVIHTPPAATSWASCLFAVNGNEDKRYLRNAQEIKCVKRNCKGVKKPPFRRLFVLRVCYPCRLTDCDWLIITLPKT